MDNEKKKDRKSFKEHDPSKYINTEPVLDEAKKGTVVVAWGRMNPMTAGHEKLVNKVISVAKAEKGVPEIYLTHSFDKKKNPLAYGDKIRLAQKAFGPVVKKSNAKTIFDLMGQLDKKYTKVVFVAGSDRVQEFSSTLEKYNGIEYKFDEIKVVSAGQRDADSDDVSGISGTKMRGFASTDMNKFKKNLPKNLKGDATAIAQLIKKGMGMSEENEIDMTEILDEALSRAGRRKRAMAMRRARAKIKLGRERAKKKRASMDVLKKRARKRAMNKLKDRFSRHKRYSDLSPAEKEQIEKRIAKVNKSRIERMAQKELIYVKRADRDKFKQVRSDGQGKNESVEFYSEDYYKGVPKDKKDDREAHFKRHAEKPGDGADKQSNYKPAPGDFKDGKRVKTKVSKHTKKYKQMYGESEEWVCGVCHCEPCVCDGGNLQLHEMWGKYTTKRPHMLMDKDNKPKFDKRFKMFKPKQVQEMNEFELEDIVELMELTEDYAMDLNEDPTASLKKKAEKTGMPMGILRKVYNRGVAAWKSGHRPGTTPEQWGHARVNSFVTKSSGTWGKADADLAAKVRKEETELDEQYHITKIYNPTTKASRAANKSTATYAVHTKDRKYFKEFPSQKEAEKHMKSLGKKEETKLDEVKRGRSTMKRLRDIQKDAENFKLKKEAAELEEGNMMSAAKELEVYARKNGGIDKNDFMKAVMMMKRNQKRQLDKFVDELDTEPREKILSVMQKHMKEEVEQLDELSPRTKASYLKKASAQNKKVQKAYDKSVKSSPDAYFGFDSPKDQERMKIMTKREKGIAMAKGRKYGQKYEEVLNAKFEAFLEEKSGAGEEGTPELVKKLKKDTPHA